ncbi:DNA polymerase IV [Halovivax limisalsi]|uniref:DNA polymerase IV n=1 Tax=Halovivax limisalsi TaxID=1453760 RepID=UPI001FFC90DF|nr:DNA polymerase IV [Halovivax limisalsi]
MGTDPQLPGVDPDPEAVDPIVLHVDADCFYAACERLRDPELRGEPLVVGMGYEAGEDVGAVATASYEAREYGVESAMAISQALEALPRRAAAEAAGESTEGTGYYRPVDMSYYESVSEDVREILHDSADVVREVSIDEAYLDVTERTDWSVVAGFARHVKQRIRREVGIPVSIGVAPTMSAAKIASDFDKPDGLTVVEPAEVRTFLAPLDVSEIHGVGPVTARELREMGLETAGDVAAADVDDLIEAFGERGREFYEYARGEDDRRVTPRGLPKSFSRESAVGDPVTDWERKRDLLVPLAESVADRATREGALYRTVGVKAVTPPYDVNTRERSLPGPVDDPDLVVEIALDLFEEFEEERVRKLGVRLANLEFTGNEQTDLGGWDAPDEDATDLGTPSADGASGPSDGTEPPGRPNARSSDERQATVNTLTDYGEQTGDTAGSDDRTGDEDRSVPLTDWAAAGSPGGSNGVTVETASGPESVDPASDPEPVDSATDPAAVGRSTNRPSEPAETPSLEAFVPSDRTDGEGSANGTGGTDCADPTADDPIVETTDSTAAGTTDGSGPPPGFTGQATLSQFAGRD